MLPWLAMIRSASSRVWQEGWRQFRLQGAGQEVQTHGIVWEARNALGQRTEDRARPMIRCLRLEGP